MKSEMIEGLKAKVNFEQTIKKLFQVSKSEIKEAKKIWEWVSDEAPKITEGDEK
jgi:hypothetical protein